MRFDKLDLNLLVALDALLAERSVTLAAERLYLSQSATSSALGRLRDYFGDELLVVRGRQMVPTARAEALAEPVRLVLNQIRTTIALAPPFDPAASDRKFRIMASDYVTEVLLSSAIRDLEHAAPNIRLEIQSMSDAPVESLERNFVDMLVTVDFAISSDHPSRILFEDDYVVMGCAENPAMRLEMTRELYFDLGHVTPRFGKARVPAFDDAFTRRMKQTRKIEVIAPTFISVPGLVIGTQRIATVHRRLAARVAAYAPVVLHELPFEMPVIREAVQWHSTSNDDAGLRWVVERIADAAKDEG